MLVALFSVLAGACTPARGWQRESARACAPGSPPVVCVQAEPDRAFEVRLGDLAILPGECARAPDGERGGRVRAVLVDPNGASRRIGLPVRSEKITFVVVDAEGKVKVSERSGCDRTVPEPLAGR